MISKGEKGDELGASCTIARGSRATHAKLVAAFTETHREKPDLLARFPGRVNLIGEHIDYEGYSVRCPTLENTYLSKSS